MWVMAWLRRGLRRWAGARAALTAATALTAARALAVVGAGTLAFGTALSAGALTLSGGARIGWPAPGLDRVDRACLAIQHPLDGLGCTIGQLAHKGGQHHAMALELELQPQVAVDVISGCGERSEEHTSELQSH